MAEKTSPQNPSPLGVVIGQVKGWIEQCGWVWVEAQVIELRRRAAPTQFLTLRDVEHDLSTTVTCMKAVLDAAGPITEGATVVAEIHPVLYEKTSSFSFECRQIQISGEGKLLAELEQLKRKLQAEGLFAPERKLPLPYLPKGIGLITGAKSAAERDVLTNICARWPAAKIKVINTLVQGPNAAAEVMDAVAIFDVDPSIDVIIIARGGGSLEDLLPFSNEGLVRAVAAARTPVVSAIGHEPDTPILDLVADLRASTPTDAAKKVVPDAAIELTQIHEGKLRARRGIRSLLFREMSWLSDIKNRRVMKHPLAGIEVQGEWLTTTQERLRRAILTHLRTEQTSLDHQLTRGRTMSPAATLERGYSILTTLQGRTLNKVADTKVGEQVTAILRDGSAQLEITQVNPVEGDPDQFPNLPR